MFKKAIQSLEKKITELSTRKYSPEPLSFHSFLSGLSGIYGVAVRCRSSLYRLRLVKPEKLPCKVISVGNLVAGGAGKTPMTIYIVKLLSALGKKMVIVSRGYKGHYDGDCAVVSDGETIFLDARMAGDEPHMMASLKICPVVVGKKRYLAGMKAMQEFNPDVIVLDDGFQHQQLHRDLNFLLLDYKKPFGNGKLLPAGRLREPVRSGLKRADAVIFTRAKKKNRTGNGKLENCSLPRFKSFHRPYLAETVSFGAGENAGMAGIDALKGRNVLLISALADNAAFCKSMKQLGVIVVEHLEFKDHYRYKESDILSACKTAVKKGAQMILTTRKDWVKLSGFKWAGADIGVVDIEIEFENPERFTSFIKERLNL